MQTTHIDGDTDEQSLGELQQDAYEWWWDERLSAFLSTTDDIATTCLEQVFSESSVYNYAHIDVLAEIDDLDAYHEMLSARRFVADPNGSYDLDWEVETTDSVVSTVYLTCHAEYIDDGRDVMTEVDVALVANAGAAETKRVSQPHVIHRPLSAQTN